MHEHESKTGNILKFAFELKNMVCHIFFAESKATHGERRQEQERGTRSRI